jgi:hypothetical protein
MQYLLQKTENGILNEIAYHFLQGALKHYWLRNNTPKWVEATIGQIDPTDDYSVFYTIPVGSVGFIQKYMETRGIEYKPIDYKNPVFYNSGIEEGTLSGIKRDNKYPVFVKPKQIKKFSGLVLDDIGEFNELLEFYRLNENEPVFYNYEVKDFLSEWRMYIHKNKVVNVSHYSGDPLRTEGISTIAKIVEGDKSMPVAYTLNIGYDRITNRWHPIEVNDFWGTGAYGCPEEMFYKATVDRWKEIISL